jgi:hypothetical protein
MSKGGNNMRVLRASNDCLAYIGSHNGKTGQIHSCFDKAVNVIFDQGTLISLVSESLGLAPMSCQIGKDEMANPVFQPGGRVQISKNTFEIEGEVLDFSTASIWQIDRASLLEPMKPEQIKIHFERFLERLIKHGKPEGLLPYLNESVCLKMMKHDRFSMPGNRYVEFAKGRIDQFIFAYRTTDLKNEKSAVQAFSRLVGFGPGLTPSTDDFVAGVMAATLICPYGRPREASALKKLNFMIATEAIGRTTVVSEALLIHAAEGHIAEKYRNLLDQLLFEPARSFDRNIDVALAHGDTSGTDFLTGVAVALMFSLNETLRRK